MKKLVWFTTAFVLTLVFVVPGVVALLIKIVPYNDQPGYSVDNRKSIFFTNVVSQSFNAQEDRLTGIGITVGNPNLKNKKDVVLKLFNAAGSLVRTSTLNGLNIPDGNFTRFLFEPIADSKGKNYTFTLESPDAREEDVLYVYFTDGVPDWVGDVIFQEEIFEEGKLAFVTYHTPISKASLVTEIYTNWLGRMVGR